MLSSQDPSDPYFIDTCHLEAEKLGSICASRITPKLNWACSLLASKHCVHLLTNTAKPPLKVTADTVVDIQM